MNGFSMNAASHVYHGLWRHVDTKQTAFNDLETWVELAQILERGCFDPLFVADVIGVDPAYKGCWDTYLQEAVQIAINDSGVLIHATTHLGLTFTSSILQEHPFNFARKVSTLDHLSKGRIGWNIVTSVSHNAAQNFGLDHIVPHDERYRLADEYVDLVYKLWEGSWDEGAVRARKAAGVYAEPSQVHRIAHEGQRYKVLGPHLSQPSLQRTPVLFQAGSSGFRRAQRRRNIHRCLEPGGRARSRSSPADVPLHVRALSAERFPATCAGFGGQGAGRRFNDLPLECRAISGHPD